MEIINLAEASIKVIVYLAGFLAALSFIIIVTSEAAYRIRESFKRFKIEEKEEYKPMNDFEDYE